MGEVVRIILILVSIVISFYGLSFGDQLETGELPTNFFQEAICSQLILHQKGAPPFSLYEKAGSENTFCGDKPIKAIRDQEFSMNLEVINTVPSPATTDIQKKKLSHFENDQLFGEKSGYHFGKTHLAQNNLDFSLNFISSLSGAKYKEENPLCWTLERLKENDILNDILKSFGILLEIKLNF